jgi:hypothetical protein
MNGVTGVEPATVHHVTRKAFISTILAADSLACHGMNIYRIKRATVIVNHRKFGSCMRVMQNT